MRKLDGYEAEVIKDIIREDSVFEIEGKRYHVAPIQESITTVKEDVEADPELGKILKQAKEDIQNKSVYSTEEVIDMIENGEI